MRDINGREVRNGDLIKIFHYIDARTKRKCYMYKIVARVNGALKIASDGQHLFAVCVREIGKYGDISRAHKCRLDVCGEFEIIDGIMVGNETWYEREKQND